MMTTGLALAVLTSIGFYFLYVKLPGRIKRFMVKHAFLTDVTACILTYTLLGGTITALFAAALVGIIVSIMLALLNNEVTAEAIERLVERAKGLQKKFVDYLASQTQGAQA